MIFKKFKHFIKGYGSVLNLMPHMNDKENLKNDFITVGKDFWNIVKKEEIKFEGRKTATR